MDCIFHIGLGKTATTYLQSEHFPRIGALGKRQGSRRFRRALRDVFLHETADYWLTRSGQSMIKRLAARKPPEEPIIYTDEALYRAPVFPRETPPVLTEQPEGRRAHKWRKLKERLGLPAQAPTRPAAEKDIQLTAALAERIREAFEPSNRLFAERSGWSLDHLGYWPGESSAKSQEGEAGRRGA